MKTTKLTISFNQENGCDAGFFEDTLGMIFEDALHTSADWEDMADRIAGGEKWQSRILGVPVEIVRDDEAEEIKFIAWFKNKEDAMQFACLWMGGATDFDFTDDVHCKVDPMDLPPENFRYSTMRNAMLKDGEWSDNYQFDFAIEDDEVDEEIFSRPAAKRDKATEYAEEILGKMSPEEIFAMLTS